MTNEIETILNKLREMLDLLVDDADGSGQDLVLQIDPFLE